LVDWNGRLYFLAADAEGQACLWKGDGRTAGTDKIFGGGTGAYFRPRPTMFATRRWIFLPGSAGGSGDELFVSNGKTIGTFPVRDLREGAASAAPKRLTACGDLVYFPVRTGSKGCELWKTDGREAGVGRLKTLPSDLMAGASMRAAGETLYFLVGEKGKACELWKSDGSTRGTARVAGFAAPAELLASAGGKAVLAVGGPTPELWTSDGTEKGTTRLVEAGPKGSSTVRVTAAAAGGGFYLSYARLPKRRTWHGFLRARPELVVEVLGENDTWEGLEKELDEYRVFGVDIVWIVDPQTRTVRVHRKGAAPSILHGSGTLTAGRLMPGFRRKASEFFD
jgi:ELWxxDGT repeat protein